MAIAIEHIHVPLHEDQDGVIRVAGTRVTLDTVIGAFTLGASAEGIVDRYDSLSLPDVYAVIAYYLAHKAKIDGYLRDHAEHAALVRAESERRSPTAGVRERLLARQRPGPGLCKDMITIVGSDEEHVRDFEPTP